MEEVNQESSLSSNNKLKIFLPIFVLVLIVFVGLLLLFYETKKCTLAVIFDAAKPSQITDYQCGYERTSSDGFYENYFGKLKNVHKVGNQFYADISFGLLSKSFPVGMEGLDKLAIIPRDKNNYLGLTSVTTDNLWSVDQDKMAELNKKYEGSFVEFSLPTSKSKSDNLAKLADVKANPTIYLDFIVKNADSQIAYWKTCDSELGEILNNVRTYQSGGFVSDFMQSLFSPSYRKCTPKVSSFDVFQ